jgi:myo-inositol 2-dehydrogenase/D-chiro-inositol 1-dehydrogenase
VTEGQALGIAVIGAGAMGRIHLAHAGAVPGARLVAVADTDLAIAKRLGVAHGVAYHGSVAEVLQEPGVDAVIVATPAETHAEIVEQSAEAGKHVLCEKPLDCRLEPIDRALRAVEKAGVRLQVGFNRRFDRNFQHLFEEVDASRVGEVIGIHIVSRDPVLPGPPRQINGMSALFFDTTVHDFDMLRFLTGSEIEMVHVQSASAIHKQAEIDTAVFLVRMTNGVIATIDNSQAVYGYDQRVEVFGTEGSLSVGNETVNTVSQAGASGFHGPRLEYFYPQRYRQSYINQLNFFVGCVTHDVAPSPSGADGRAATSAALAAQRSVDECRPVRISEIG